MAEKENKSNKPDFVVTTPIKHGEKTFWRIIGAAWKKDDNISISLDAAPIHSGTIFLAPPKEDEKK